MKKYTAKMMDAGTGGEGAYEFQHENDLFKEPADDIVNAFFEHVDKEVAARHVNYEINAAFKNKHRRIVTAIGSLIIEANGREEEQPFLLMIAEA
jgi:hypothetical protein